MKQISDDVSISYQYCLIQREEIFLHDFRVHPQYIRIDIELPEDDVFDFMTSVTNKYPLTSSAPKVLALPMSWSTQHNSFAISTDRSFQKKVSLSEWYERFISSSNMKIAVCAITWRNAFSLIVVIELQTLPINPTFVSKSYQVFKSSKKQKLQVLHGTFLLTPTETDPHLATTSSEKEPNEILTPNRTQTTPSNVTFAFAPLCVAFRHVSQSAALLGTVSSIKAAPPSEIPTKFPFSTGHAWKIAFKNEMSAWLAHVEVIDSIKFLTPNVNTMALQNALNAFPPHDTWHAKLLLAKTMGSVEALNYATSSLAIPFDVSPQKETPVSSPSSSSLPKPASTSSPLPKSDKQSADPSFVHQPYATPTDHKVSAHPPLSFVPISMSPRHSVGDTNPHAVAQKEGFPSRLLPEVMTLDTPTPSSSLSKKISSLVRRGRHSKSTHPSTAATPSPQEPGDEPQQSLPTDTAKSLQMDLDQASHLTVQVAGTSTHSCQQQSQPVHVDDSVNLQIPETPLAPPQNTSVLAIPHNEVTLIRESPVPSSPPDPDPTHSPRSPPTSPRGAPIAHRTRANSSPPQNKQKRNKATAGSKLVLSPNANVYSSIGQHVASSISMEPSKESSGIPKKRHGKKANS